MLTNGRHAAEPRPPARASGADLVRVGIVGLGRAGWNIHAKTLARMTDRFRITAIMDPDAGQRAEAETILGCRAVDTFEALLDESIDLVVVASPSHLHADQSIAAMRTGRHVVCEKPFGLSADDAEQMIEIAHDAGVVLAPFQNRRYEANYRKVREIIDSGALGEILQIRLCWHRFSRRWDWQALKRFGGGALFNNGTHLLDQAMAMLGDAEPELFLDLRRGLSLGDADEHLKLVLREPGGPTIDIEYTNASAFEHDRWHIMGTHGGLRGTQTELEWRVADWSRMPERELELGPARDRKYPTDEVVWIERRWAEPAEEPHPYELLYADVHGAIRRGSELGVTPESALRCLRVLDRCAALMPSEPAGA
ncbi:MAG: Gfo/Idh/MocA family oxidoreductase [Planctomycetota bacterium]